MLLTTRATDVLPANLLRLIRTAIPAQADIQHLVQTDTPVRHLKNVLAAQRPVPVTSANPPPQSAPKADGAAATVDVVQMTPNAKEIVIIIAWYGQASA